MPSQNIIYFDNAATSWPKPEATFQAMENYLRHYGGNPGRSGHRLSLDAARIVLAAREAVAELFGIEDALRVVFTKNGTEALNLAIYGLLQPGDHVITSSMEHNSVMRPLRTLEKQGVEMTVLPCSATGELDPGDIAPALRPNTRAIYLTSASNVTGTLMPLAEVGKIARKNNLIFCVDAAQCAGSFPLNVEELGIDLLAFTGHKALYGPQGTGGLYIREGLEGSIRPLMTGGTGSRSEFEEQPDFMPDKFESGTPNAVGLAGLEAGVRCVLERGVAQIRAQELHLTELLLDGLKAVPGIVLFGPEAPSRRIAVISFAIQGLSPADIALALDEEDNIMCRPGLHCAPAAHKTIGTFPVGTTRFSLGVFNTEEQVNTALEAINRLAGQARRNI
ncbi:cysteine desulfurase family protein [Syntrophus gentianae]|uniref:cysteine desulfurase n=1 Tax=Syntrophus gentianae TaxID=43775 RepID=A0A1H7YUB8_9BACT|nr:aminotransferase class V-fold PLP-dependent enzyme [Syntrophus gentianae]SEM49812.1 cysteine desulfurase family protein [Syntrophus gentianae]